MEPTRNEDATTEQAEATKKAQEEQAEVLKGLSEEELRQMCRRLAKSQEDFKQGLEDLQVEQIDLKEENTQLHGTIALIMEDLKKLNIGADNLAEPQIDEGPVEFIGRLWEKMKPRDNVVQISEHVGEIRKPVPTDEEHSPQAIAKRIRDQLNERLATFSSAVESGDATPVAEFSKQVAERGHELQKQVADRFSTISTSIGEFSQEATFESVGESISKQGQELGEKVSKQRQELVETVSKRFSDLSEGGEVREQLAKQGQELGEALGKHSKTIEEKFTKQKQEFNEMISRVQEGGVSEEISKQGQELGELVNKRFLGAVSFFSKLREDIVAEPEPARFEPPDRTPSVGSFFNYFSSPGGQKQHLGPDSAGPGLPDTEEVARAAAKAAEVASSSGSSSSTSAGSSGSSDKSDSEQGSKAIDEQQQLATAAAHAEATAAAEGPPSATSSKAEEEAETKVESSLLIEVELTLDDYSVQVLQLRAADRCKDVAARFIREHSLKAWFEAPLKSYLMEQEAQAETFPAMLKADLMEIRKQYSSQNKV